jgi:hypothetical protein
MLPSKRHRHFAIIIGIVNTLILFRGVFRRALKVIKIPS